MAKIQYFLGWLSRPDVCNWLSDVGYRPDDVIMVATSLVQAQAIGAWKIIIKCI